MTTRVKPCPHGKCEHGAHVHVGGFNSCEARGCQCPNAPCPRCEAYEASEAANTPAICHLKGIGYYNATKAEALARRKRRKPVTISARMMRRFVTERAVYPPHTLHVNTRKFVVIGTYVEPGDGERQFMLDGSHRGFVRSRTGRSTKAYVLDLDETLSVYDGKRPPRGKRFTRK